MAVWSPSALPVSLVGVGKLPLLLQSGVPADHADDDGCVVHHVLQVRGLCGPESEEPGNGGQIMREDAFCLHPRHALSRFPT